MKQATLLSEEALIGEATRVIFKNLGPVEGQRFFSLCSQKRMESVHRHRLWQKSLEKRVFLNKILEKD